MTQSPSPQSPASGSASPPSPAAQHLGVPAWVDRAGKGFITALHYLGLAVVTVAIMISGGAEAWRMFAQGIPHLGDILLLFIYLELLAMVGIYFRTLRLPVRFLVYIAITALTRLVVVEAKSLTFYEILAIATAVLLLALSVLVVKYGSARYPSASDHQHF